MSTWHEIWQSEFGYIRPSPEVWESELAHDVRGVDQAEILRAVRDMKFDPNMKDRPTLKDLRIRLYVNRKKDRGEDEDVTGCELCNDGWLTTWRKDDTLVSLPCACTRGGQWREKLTEPSERGIMLDHAKRAIKRNVLREQERVKLGLDLLASGYTIESLMAASPRVDKSMAVVEQEDASCPF